MNRRTRYRLSGGALAVLVTLVLFREPLASAGPLLWPPGGPRWATFVLVVLLSFAVPLMVGAALGEALAERGS
ncbi:hypothetical protein [Natronomonas sp. EA1]|uniref:hypothetical protein n=1 Tax=Natronomonas sp. EA1 TaxID=3421655 RepID=UPI003EB88B16